MLSHSPPSLLPPTSNLRRSSGAPVPIGSPSTRIDSNTPGLHRKVRGAYSRMVHNTNASALPLPVLEPLGPSHSESFFHLTIVPCPVATRAIGLLAFNTGQHYERSVIKPTNRARVIVKTHTASLIATRSLVLASCHSKKCSSPKTSVVPFTVSTCIFSNSPVLSGLA